jgi:hypothetical protein
MNETEQKMETAGGSEIEALRNEVQSLQGLLAFGLMLVLILSVAVNIFLYKQAADRSTEARNAQMIVNNFVNGGEVQAREFWFKLSAYASTHPDFAPVYNKWSQIITIRPPAPGASPLAAPAKK